MNYKITIIKQVENPDYIPTENRPYAYMEGRMDKYNDEQVLLCQLNEEEFSAIKKAVIEVIK